jgi:hypothetical protein
LNKYGDFLGKKCIEFLSTASKRAEQFVTEAQLADSRYEVGTQREPWETQDQSTLAKPLSVPMEATIVDAVTAAYMSEGAQATGWFRAVARGTATQEQASVTKAFMDMHLKRTQGDEQIKTAFTDFCLHPYVGMIPRFYKSTVRERRPQSIPAGQMIEDGVEIIGEGQIDQATGVPQSILVANVVGEEKEMVSFGLEPVSCYRLFVHSPNIATVQHQPSIHILHAVSKYHVPGMSSIPMDIEDVVVGKSEYNIANVGFEEGGGVYEQDQDTAEVWETWIDPTMFAIPENVSEEDVLEFQQTFEMTKPFLKGDKWCIFHDKEGKILRVEENPAIRQNNFPVSISSFFQPRNGLIGKSLFHRVSDVCLAMEEVISKGAMVHFKRTCPSAFIDAGARVDSARMREAMETAFFLIQVPGNGAQKLESLQWIDIPDTSASAQFYLNTLTMLIQRIGVPDVALGATTGDTATEAEISTGKANMRLALPMRSFSSRVLCPALEGMRDMILRHSRDAEWITLVGEPGLSVRRSQWVSPADLTDQIEIVTPFTNEFADFSRLQMQLISMLKIGAAYGVGVDTFGATARIIMESLNMPPTVIDAFMDTLGSQTTVFEELKVLSTSPTNRVVVRNGDNSTLALMALAAWREANPDKAGWPNVAEYETAHLLNYAAQQEMMAAQNQMEMEGQPKGKSAKGNPNTRGRLTSDMMAQSKDAAETERGVRSQEAQLGVERSGDKLNAGMTGRGA